MTGTPLREDITLRVDGSVPVSAATIGAVQAFCDRVEAAAAAAPVVIHVTGVPREQWTDGLTTALVSKWEQALRRVERLAVPTVAVAVGDCGGPALDALLTTDLRVATRDARLIVAVAGGAPWPGMALYRLSRWAGSGAVRRAALFGVALDAAAARAAGLLDAVADGTEEAAVIESLTASLAPSLARGAELAGRRQLLRDAGRMSFEDALGAHLAARDLALRRGVGT